MLALGSSGLQAQRIVEWQVQATAAVTGAQFLGGGLGLALRPRGRTRVGLAVNGGVEPETWDPLGRAEITFQYMLNPWTRAGVSPYAGGGAVVQAWAGRSDEFLLLVVGIESRPGAGSGWFVEVGLGGGLRAALGVRLRRRR